MNGLKMLLAMALFFGVMYLYCWLPEFIEPYKAKKRAQKEAKKEELRIKHREAVQQNIDKENKVFENRRKQIKEHRKWLESMNTQIKKRFNIDKNALTENS